MKQEDGSLVSDAIKLRASADEQAALRDGDARTQVVVAFIAQRGRVKQFELFAGFQHENIAAMVQKINFAIGGGRRSLDLRLAARVANPFRLAAVTHDAGGGAPGAGLDVKPAVVQYCRADV